MIGRWHGLVIDRPDPGKLAEFYQELLGMQRVQDEVDWVVIDDAPDRPGVAFQRVADLRPPQWPNPDHPQQLHVDVRVSELDQAEKDVLALGARRLSAGEAFRVFSDPAGHPFSVSSRSDALAIPASLGGIVAGSLFAPALIGAAGGQGALVVAGGAVLVYALALLRPDSQRPVSQRPAARHPGSQHPGSQQPALAAAALQAAAVELTA